MTVGVILSATVGFALVSGIAMLWYSRLADADKSRLAGLKQVEISTSELSLEAARAAAEALIASPDVFVTEHVVPSTGPLPVNCPEAAIDVLTRYARIVRVDNAAFVDRAFVRPYVGGLGYVQIGEDDDSTVLAAKTSGLEVYVLDGFEAERAGQPSATYASVYHWIVSAAWVVKGEE